MLKTLCEYLTGLSRGVAATPYCWVADSLLQPNQRPVLSKRSISIIKVTSLHSVALE